jgi:Carboxypeptidase regulatory-like domain/TonB-dependent Receptor Plug Domain
MNLKWKTLRKTVASLLTVFLLLPLAAFAQESGQISVKATDPSKAVVPGASVTIKSVERGTTQTATTNEEGVALFTGLQPGQYDVTVTGGGFAPLTQRAQVTVGAKLTLEAELSAQAKGEVVNVVAGEGGVEVNTQNQELSNVVSQKQITELPTLTRNAYDLVGISGNVSDAATGNRGTGFSINGQRSASTSILLDGAENVDNFTATVGQAVPLDSVQEFRVITGNFSAEYGRASGGIVNVATNAGSNTYHGTIYEFNRISALASNGFDNNAREIDKQVFTRNQFGYSIGGPIKKNKLFFFSDTEWIRVRSGGARVAWVPTQQFINASGAATKAFFAPYTLNGSTGKTISASEVITAFGGAAAFKATPNAATNAFLNLPGGLPVFQQVTFATPRDVGGGLPENEYQSVDRIDYNWSDKTQLYGRYAIQNQVFAQGTNAFSPYDGFSTGSTARNQNFILNLTHTFSSKLVSQTKLAFNRLNGGQPLGAQPLVPTLYMSGARTVNLQGVNIYFPGYLPNSPGNAIPFNGAQNVYQVNEDVNYTMGKHNFRLGGQIVHIRDNKTFGAYSYAVEALGNTNPEALSNFLTSNLVSFSVAIDPGNRFPGESIPLPVGPPAFSRSNRYTEWAGYVNDSWHVSQRLTLNLGLRYEYYGVQHNAQDPHLDANFFYGGGASLQEKIRAGRFLTTPESPNDGLWAPDKNNFAPRVGFAWDINGDGRTSLRGGYGMAYERNFGNVTFNVLFNPPNYGVVALTANSGATAGDVPSLPISIANYGPFSGTGPARLFAPVSARAVDPNIVNAYAHFYSASFERQIFNNTVVSLEYSGSLGEKLYSISDINRTGAGLAYGLGTIKNAVGATTSRLNPFITSANQRSNLGHSRYNALIASFDSSNFHNSGLTFTARYTYSLTKDNLSSTFAETGQTFFLGFTDTFRPDVDYGRADFDVRHRFVSSFNYEPPYFNKSDNKFVRHVLGGWSLNGIVNIQSGAPFTIYDCTFANATCARLDATHGSVVVNKSNPVNTGDANSFTLVDLSGFRDAAGNVINPITPNPKVGNYNFGPYPDVMDKRNAYEGPGFMNFNSGLYKKIQITERVKVQLRAEVFNLFNHANLFVDYGSPDVSAGDVLSFRDGRRNVQLAAKIIF